MANQTNARKARVRKRMFKKQKGRCHLCGETMAISPRSSDAQTYATFDHLVPKSLGGPGALTNLRLAHKRCNVKRGNMPLPSQPETGEKP
jgi:5-methylcytosine-specific restriction endonuclease McrA